MILDSLERLEGVESIHIMLEAKGGDYKTQKFIFLAFFAFFALKCSYRHKMIKLSIRVVKNTIKAYD